jgi:ribosomal protein S7
MKKITIYKDFEAQKNQEIEETLKMSPKERITQVVALIKKIYPPGKQNKTKRIVFQSFSTLHQR